MKKVKVFKFEVTNFTYTADENEMKQEACKRAKIDLAPRNKSSKQLTNG